MKNIKALSPIIGVAALIIILFAWGIMSKNSAVTYVPGTNVACLPSGHQNLAEHIHPTLTITVDGVPEIVPENIGLTTECMAEVHTHDATGTIHIETVQSGRLAVLALSDFFAVWGTPLEREGYTYVLTVDGNPVTDPSSSRFVDHQAIVLSYTSVIE